MSNYHIKSLDEYFHVYRKSVRNPELFWEEIAEENFIWRKRWNSVLRWDFKKPKISHGQATSYLQDSQKSSDATIVEVTVYCQERDAIEINKKLKNCNLF